MSVAVRCLLAVLAAALWTAGGLATSADASPGARMTAPPSSPGMQPCAPSDLTLREIPLGAAGGLDPVMAYALKNSGSAACRISGGVGIRLFDADGNAAQLRFAPRTAMPMLLTLAPGDEAWFTLTYVLPLAGAACTAAGRIEVFVPPQTAAVAVKTSLAACSGATVRVSNLRAGVPTAVPTTAPSVDPTALIS